MTRIEQELRDRILILDGAMGTMIQQYALTEKDYRGTRFAHLPGQMKGNNDMLNITRPDVIRAIHGEYLEAGADIIETNSFNSTVISMADYGMEQYVRELNFSAARIAREIADEYTKANPAKPRFVAGSVGPTNKAASISPDVSNPAFRAISFDQLKDAFQTQMEALIDGGVDLLLIETAFDTLNVKAALIAAEESMKMQGRTLPVMLSFTIAGKSGRLLSGQTLKAALASVSHVNLLSVGLNCSFGAKDMKPFLKDLGNEASCYISAYPNAGLPNSLGQYDETPETMEIQVREYIEEGLVNILGGCCGTTPGHIAAMTDLVKNGKFPVRQRSEKQTDDLVLSGLDALVITPENNFVNIGERCNVAGSRKFLRLIKEKSYEEALSIARKQVDDGAQILDINMDDGLLDGVDEMTRFLNLLSSEPDIARVPVVIDSSDWNVIEAGLKCLQGKSIVNSISLKNGEDDFLAKAGLVRSYGAAVVAMAFDEEGQADTFERKIAVCQRMYHLLIDKAGYNPADIIFDPNVLAIATGIEEHSGYGLAFIQSVEWIKKNLPGAKVSGGVSNLSFSFRGNNYLREAMHAVFLYHAIRKGMDMGIVNPSTTVAYEDIPKDLLVLIEDVVLNNNSKASERLIEYASSGNFSEQKVDKQTQQEWRSQSLEGRLQYALMKGVSEYLEEDLKEALTIYPNPIDIIDKPLMGGLNIVGELFGEGKMFLPQVVKSARIMKRAVEILQPALENSKKNNATKAGKILFATVKGDVHDIGKNITGVVLSCNNYEIIDIGVMVPAEEIIQKAKEYNVDMIALSGLITPSLQEMAFVAAEMERAGFDKPLLIGGATTSKLHTALKIDPLYHGPVVQVSDASQAVPVANKLLNTQTSESYTKEIKAEYASLRAGKEEKKKELVSLAYAKAHPFVIDWSEYETPVPSLKGSKVMDGILLQDVIPHINWKAFLAAWKLPVKHEETEALLAEANNVLADWVKDNCVEIKAIVGFYPATVEDQVLNIEGRTIPLLRQQEKRGDNIYKSMADFINPSGDYVGLFAVTVQPRSDAEACICGCDEDILAQLLRDRLAEAATEYIHEKVRRDVLKSSHRGIRPAAGYAMHPDISLNFIIDDLLQMDRVGMRLTSNGAIDPSSSTSGLFIIHPEAAYFHLGEIDDDQLKEYAARKNSSTDEVRKWLGL